MNGILNDLEMDHQWMENYSIYGGREKKTEINLINLQHEKTMRQQQQKRPSAFIKIELISLS